MRVIEGLYRGPCALKQVQDVGSTSVRMLDCETVAPLLLKDFIRCPHCQSANIVYTCEPKCCFNHICADCRSTFQLNTERSGRFDRETVLTAKEPPSGEPTAACANCESLKIAVLDENSGELLCVDCRAVSKLMIEEFVAGS